MEWNTYERFPPLVLMLGGREKYRVLRTLRDAAEVLIADWPSEDGEEYVVAVKACVDAITHRPTRVPGWLADEIAASER